MVQLSSGNSDSDSLGPLVVTEPHLVVGKLCLLLASMKHCGIRRVCFQPALGSCPGMVVHPLYRSKFLGAQDLEGFCYCGAVTFSVRADATVVRAAFCHCESCRRAHAAPLYQINKNQLPLHVPPTPLLCLFLMLCLHSSFCDTLLEGMLRQTRGFLHYKWRRAPSSPQVSLLLLNVRYSHLQPVGC